MVTVVVVVAPEAEREVVVVDRWRSARDGLPAIAAGLLDDEASPLLLSPPLSLAVDDEPRAATVPPTRDDGARVVRARRPGRPGKAFWSSPDGPDSPCDSSGMFAARLPLQIHQENWSYVSFTKHLLAPGLALPMSCSVLTSESTWRRRGQLGDRQPCPRAGARSPCCCCSCP